MSLDFGLDPDQSAVCTVGWADRSIGRGNKAKVRLEFRLDTIRVSLEEPALAVEASTWASEVLARLGLIV